MQTVIQQFALGAVGQTPTPDKLDQARRIVWAIIDKAVAHDIEVDEIDGAITFMLRASSGYLVMGKLPIHDDLAVNVYNDQHPDINAGIDDIWVKHLPHSSIEDFIDLI